MAKPIPFPNFVGPTYTVRSRIAGVERCANLYPELSGSQGAKAQMVLFPTPGMSLHASGGTGSIRAAFSQDGRAFVVIGATFYEDVSGVLTAYGTMAIDSNPATISSSGTQLMITSGTNIYIFTLASNTFSGPIASVNATQGAFLDGFFIALNPALNQINISNYYDGLTWDPTQFRIRARGSDTWQAIIVVHGEIWLLGTRTFEVWGDAGTAPFPFQQIPGLFFNQGVEAAFSVQQLGETVIWLADNRDGEALVVMAVSYSPQRISTHAVEFAIGQYTDADRHAAIGMVYQREGHTFYGLNFNNDSWFYDMSTQMWHERFFWDAVNGVETAWRGAFHMNYAGKNIVGDRLSGNLYALDLNTYTDPGGALIRRVRRLPHVFNGKQKVTYDQLELDAAMGIGLASPLAQGYNPQVMLRWSDDGGFTYGNEITAPIGLQGQYANRAMWNKLGASRDRVFELSMTDPVAWAFVNLYLRARPGIH